MVGLISIIIIIVISFVMMMEGWEKYDSQKFYTGLLVIGISIIMIFPVMQYNMENMKSVYKFKKLKEMKKDDTVRNLLESKFDREMIAVLLGVDKNEIAEILQRCNYSESFIQTANDLQIMDAISGCYEEYKVLKKK